MGAPTRGPIELLCDERMGPRLANAALRRNLTRGAGGVFLLVISLALGVVAAGGFHSALLGALTALTMLVVPLVSGNVRARRSFGKMVPSGQLLTSCYDDGGRLTLSTAIGTSALAPGSIDRVERRAGLIHLRTVRGRRWIVLPGQLLTDDDSAYLLDRHRTSPSPPLPGAGLSGGALTLEAPGRTATQADTQPLIHVLDQQSRRDLQAAMARHVLRGRNGRLLVACLLFTVVCTALVRDWVAFSLLGLMAVVAALAVVAPVLAVRRSRPLGHLVRAAVTPTHLVVQDGDSESLLPWASIRSCTTTRRAVLLVLRQGVVLPLPRSLFPQTELAQLQQLVRRHCEG